MQRRRFISMAAAAPLVGTPAIVRAADIPKGPVRFIVGFAPGGGTDTMARTLAQRLAELWGVSVVVENKPGAVGTIAAAQVARSAPDGNTLLVSTISDQAVVQYASGQLPYSPEKDLIPIMLIGITPMVLVHNGSQRARNCQDLVAECREKPGRVAFGSAGIGGSQHLALELFKLRTGIDALHVPYNGSTPMIADLIGGQIHYSFDTMTASLPHIRSGRLTPIAVTHHERSRALPEVPTVAEQGFPGFQSGVWYGINGPAGMSPALVSRINADLATVMASAGVRQRLEANSADGGGGSAEQFAAFIAAERRKWSEVVARAKISL